ncbi:MAG: hypothetical protein JWO30_2304 [Fibrobacteres bacterium]|nr:hypothetical protein [Fibrobacterota bacterium]
MAIVDKIVTLICLFAGFFWLRERARSIRLENQIGKSVIGVFVLLPAILLGEKYLFDNFHFGTFTDLFLKAVLLLATFPIVGFTFLKPGSPDPAGSPDPESGENPTASGEAGTSPGKQRD